MSMWTRWLKRPEDNNEVAARCEAAAGNGCHRRDEGLDKERRSSIELELEYGIIYGSCLYRKGGRLPAELRPTVCGLLCVPPFLEQAGSLAAALQNFDPSVRPGEPLRLPLRMARRVPLEGEELAAWQAAKVAEAAAAQEVARMGSGVMGGLVRK